MAATAAPRVVVVAFAPALIKRAGRRGLDALFGVLARQLVGA